MNIKQAQRHPWLKDLNKVTEKKYLIEFYESFIKCTRKELNFSFF